MPKGTAPAATSRCTTAAEAAAAAGAQKELPPGHKAVSASVPGNVWKINVRPGQRVTKSEPLVILESMKMEISVLPTEDCEVTEVLCAEGRPVQAGDALVIVKPLT